MGIPRKRFISGSVFCVISPSPVSGHRVGTGPYRYPRIKIGARRRKAGQSQSQSGDFPTSFC